MVLILALVMLMNRSSFLWSGQIGQWKFDEQDVPAIGQTPDFSEKHHANYYNGWFLEGVSNTAFFINGDSDSEIKIFEADRLNFLDRDFTICMWVKFIGDTSLGEIRILAEKYAGNLFDGSGGWLIYAVDHFENGPYNRRLELYSAESSRVFQGSYDFITDQWYHIAITRQNDTLSSYVNGQPLQDYVLPSEANFNDFGITLYLGNDDRRFFAPLNGGIDDVRIFDESLDQAAILSVMDLSEGPYPVIFGDNGGRVTVTPEGAVPPLMVKRTVLGGAPHGQAVAVFTNTVDRQDVSIKVESTQELAGSNLWFANTFHDVSGSFSMGVNPGTPLEMSIVFNEDSSTIPSSVPHPRYTVAADAVIVSQRATGFSIGNQTSAKSPEATLDVQGNAILSVPDAGLILTAPNGTRYKVTISDSGQLTVTQL